MGGALTVGYTYLFGFHNFRMHLVTTAVVSTSLALVIVLIIALDWPFRGRVSVTPDAFVKTEQSWSDPSFATPGPLEGQGGGRDAVNRTRPSAPQHLSTTSGTPH
jgi:hypothetical protein